MVLTPADVHNVAFSKPRLGKRGYDEQEVDLFIDLVERELIRHLDEEAELRGRCAELGDVLARVRRREADLSEWETALGQQERDTRQRDDEVARREAQLAQREAQFVKKVSALPQQLAQLRHREAQAAEREAALRGRENELREWEDGLSRREAELLRRMKQQQPADCRDGGVSGAGQAALPVRDARPLGTVLARAAAVNGASHLEESRAVASIRGRHDIERMAIRAVSTPVAGTVHERARRDSVESGNSTASRDGSNELERLRKENAELVRSVGLLKSAAALLAAALDGS